MSAARFRAGEPAWIELVTDDPAAAETFYTDLLGWSVRHERLASGTYRMCRLGDHDVAGIADAALLHRGRPDGWVTYVAVDDVEAAAARAIDLGGELAVPPRYLPDAGSGATVVDPQGAVLGLYQGENRAGVQLLNTAGSLCWNELSTGDLAGSVDFYRGLFGYGTERRESSTGRAYSVLTLDDEPVAGVLELETEWPNVLPARWVPYLGVDAIGPAVDRLVGLGGTHAIGPVPSAHGLIHVVRDHQGHAFDLIELSSGLRRDDRLPTPDQTPRGA